MSLLLDLLGWAFVSAFALMGAAFLLETLLGLLSTRSEPSDRREGASHLAILLVPAHDEALIIGQTVSDLKENLPASTRILVVADNCSDDTATVVRSAGVEVIERNEPNRRGKGYALEFGRAYLRSSPPKAVIVVDADCAMDRRSIRRLLDVSVTHKSPAQARNLLKPDLGAPPLVQISNFAFMVKNYVRQLGAYRLGAAAVLTGTGMAFPWAVFDRVNFSGGSVEDLDLTVELVGAGIKPVFVPDATVLSEPAGLSASVMQRDRWERGFLAAARQAVPRLLRQFGRTGSPPALWLALHLLTPPLALLVLLGVSVALLLTLVYLFAGASAGPMIVQWGLMLFICLLVGAAWAKHGRPYLAAGTLLRTPMYVLWKLPIYTRMLTGAERRWNRTDRTDL